VWHASRFLQKPVDDEARLAASATALAQDDRRRDSQLRHTVLSQRVAALTPRERDVLGLLTTGLRNKEIAYDLGTSERTIKAHRSSLMQMMQVTSVAELVRLVAMEERDTRHAAQPQPSRGQVNGRASTPSPGRGCTRDLSSTKGQYL
jgi:FixJ family two-component response regulator